MLLVLLFCFLLSSSFPSNHLLSLSLNLNNLINLYSQCSIISNSFLYLFIICRRELPPLTLSLLYRIILLSVIGYVNIIYANYTFGFWQKWILKIVDFFFFDVWPSSYGGNICAFKGIEYTSPALASAINNLPPAFTFILAVVFRFYSSFPFLSFS